MKTIAFIICLCIGALPIAAQNTILEKRISMTLNAIPMEETIERIAETADIHVSYSSDLLFDCAPVTLNVKNELLLTVLNKLFAPYKISYTVHAGQLILFPKKNNGHQRIHH